MIKNPPSRPLAHPKIGFQVDTSTDISDNLQTVFKKLFNQLMRKYKKIQSENIKFRATLMDYAETDWKTLTLLDRGKNARKILKEINHD